jgi:hypothetical protein
MLKDLINAFDAKDIDINGDGSIDLSMKEDGYSEELTKAISLVRDYFKLKTDMVSFRLLKILDELDGSLDEEINLSDIQSLLDDVHRNPSVQEMLCHKIQEVREKLNKYQNSNIQLGQSEVDDDFDSLITAFS